MARIHPSDLAEHLDAALATLTPATTARLLEGSRAHRRSAIATLAQVLAARLNAESARLPMPDTAHPPRFLPGLH
ncbi:hypothetical protein IP88_04090 [alpha proteobacterium AAP81b]|nr:hypothetical protein IP88_04090 [alpha proteobacterium AAP81b]